MDTVEKGWKRERRRRKREIKISEKLPEQRGIGVRTLP